MNGQADLYQQLIIDHNRKPRNFRKIDDPGCSCSEGLNPLCGDHLLIFVLMDESGETIQDISFQGSGCAISKASASIMTDMLKGKTKKEAEELFELFHNLLKGQEQGQQQVLKPGKMGKLQVFSGVWKYPSRVKCASLAWHAMIGAFEQKKTVSTE